MIYLFTGNCDYLIAEQIRAWKHKFIEKFSDFNVVEIKNIKDTDKNFLVEALTASSFLSEKKLTIIHCENDKSQEKYEFLLDTLKKVPEENIVILAYPNPDKRSKSYKDIKKISETKEFNIMEPHDILSVIQKKYPGMIDTAAIKTLIQYKAGDIGKIMKEIEKLSITKSHINEQDIKTHIIPELEESIFQIINDILGKNIIDAILKINIILNHTNIYGLYNSILANLRTTLYILHYKNQKVSPSQIGSELDLGKRSFLINKNYVLGYESLRKVYKRLVKLDKQMKTGKLGSNEDEYLKLQIEKILISI